MTTPQPNDGTIEQPLGYDTPPGPPIEAVQRALACETRGDDPICAGCAACASPEDIRIAIETLVERLLVRERRHWLLVRPDRYENAPVSTPAEHYEDPDDYMYCGECSDTWPCADFKAARGGPVARPIW